MDQLDEAYRGQITALLRAMSVAKGARDDDVPCQIEEGLYLGSIGAANNKSALRSLNITHILTVASSMPSYPKEFKYKIVDVQDRPDVSISRYFDDCFGFIDEAREMGGKVLVHCFAGISRSVTIIVAYLIKECGLSCSEALEHVKSKRAVASPNPGFLLQLHNFEKSLRGEMTELPFGRNRYSKGAQNSAAENTTRLPPSTQANAENFPPPTHQTDKQFHPRNRRVAEGEAARQSAAKRPRIADEETPATSPVSSSFGTIAEENFSVKDVKTWTARDESSSEMAFKLGLGEAFFHGLKLVSAKNAQVAAMERSLKKYKDAATSSKDQIKDLQKKFEDDSRAKQQQLDEFQGAFDRLTLEAKQAGQDHARAIYALRQELDEVKATKDKELSEAYSLGFMGYLEAFLAADPEYD